MWSIRRAASRGTLGYFIWDRRVSEQIDARAGGSSSESVPEDSRRSKPVDRRAMFAGSSLPERAWARRNSRCMILECEGLSLLDPKAANSKNQVRKEQQGKHPAQPIS